MDLLAGDSDDDKDEGFKINKNYAQNYEKWRKKEEKQKLLDRYGDVDTSDSSSDDEEIRSTAQMDKDWLRTFAVVKFQQPRLFKKGEKFFHDEAVAVSKKKEKATTLKDHERKFLLEKGGIESDEESKPKQPVGKSYFEEQEEIKQSFKEALGESSDEDEEILTKKEKTEEEKHKEENDYLLWLKGMKEELDDKEAAAELAPLKEFWSDPNIDEKERVLRDYILNNGYMDQEDSSDDSDDNEEKEVPNFDVEEEFLKKAEDYEYKYNFRHEEPGSDELKSYPRVIESSLRTKDTRRADKRQKKMEKKRTLKEQRKEEIRLLQKIQMEEKREKLEKLKKIADNPDLEYDLDADFDPEEHNRIMQNYFNEDYYGENETEVKKPEFEYDAAVDEEPDNWWKERLTEEAGDKEIDDKAYEEDYEPGVDDPNFIMDADYDPTKDYKLEKKNKKKKKGLVEKLPIFDPTKKTFDEYINEYLKDKIDDLPFTYREVVPNDYGLTTEEILKAPERELNSWVSVKKMSQYKSKQEETAERRKFQARASQVDKKRKILPSLLEVEVKEPKPKKRRKKKKNTSETGELKVETTVSAGEVSDDNDTTIKEEVKSELQSQALAADKLKGTPPIKEESILFIKQEVLPEKKKKKKKRKKTPGGAGQNTEADVSTKKKKKRISIRNFGAATEVEVKVTDSRQLARQLEKVMSVARLSKYGIGPSAVKMKKKRRKKQKNTQNEK